MESDDTWLTETLYDDVRMSIKVDRVLFDSQTEHQHLVVAESERFGRMFTLDGVTQLTMADEFVYHEMLAHVPILAHGAARDIGIVGGGDGGLVEEVLKHPTVERVTIAELDAGVIDFARTYLGELSRGAFDDRRVEIVLGDGAEFVATTERRFDVIVVDSTDPIGPGAALFTPEFYANCKRVLQPGGVLVTQNGVPFFQPAELESTMRIFGGLFADATCYLGVVPTYVGGFMAFGWGTDEVGLRTLPLITLRERFDAARLDTRYYTPSSTKRASPCHGSSATSWSGPEGTEPEIHLPRPIASVAVERSKRRASFVDCVARRREEPHDGLEPAARASAATAR